MNRTTLILAFILAVSGLFGGCNTVPDIPDKTPCTSFIRASGGEPPPCRTVPINTPTTYLLEA